MRQLPSLPCLCAALVAIFCLTLSAVPEAHAGKGKGKSGFFRASDKHLSGGHRAKFKHHRHSRHGHFKQKRFNKHGRRSRFVGRRDHKHRSFHARGYYYGYDRGYRYRDYRRPEPSYGPEESPAVQPYQNRPVTPKWVHVSSSDGALGPPIEGSYAEGGLRRNCLSVKTEITVDGQPMDAFGEACLSADGTWELKPSEPNE